ncbi:MAG: hypothetical protein HY791_27950 [Deltaproteobacteria bacterium]|nr:hypothetical protein [Deltaproteobacteria bacterium]
MANRSPGDAPGASGKSQESAKDKPKAAAPKPAPKAAQPAPAPKGAQERAVGELPRAQKSPPKKGEESDRQSQGQSQGQSQEQPPPDRPAMPSFKPGQVNQGFIRDAPVQVDRARAMGLAQSPGTREVIAGKLAERMGASFAELLPGARSRGPNKLEEPELQPPPFLSPFEAMKDIFMRSRGRASPKTLELLGGTDLEDLVHILGELHNDSEKLRKPEARIKGSIFTHVRDSDSPILVGYQDPRLSEPWRLFLAGWEIWVPEGKKGGVELFWEGEAEDDDGQEIQITQSLKLIEGELTLDTHFGEDRDSVIYDGNSFFRLKSGAPQK